ncbi:MAG: TrkH family potassium uptake protein [Lachnospiraceae bacterium]
MRIKNHRYTISSFQLILLSFLLVILFGSVLLTLPFATIDGKGASFSDALFTSTSATCVTGLIVQNTADYWSLFGQIVILLLIQIGGMGVVTVAVSVSVFAGRKIGLMQRSTMQEAVSAHHIGGIVRLTGFILKLTFLIELLGACCLFPSFYKEFGLKRGIWYSIFHSISAFCNAGFDLMGEVKGDTSLMMFAGNPFVVIPICILIVFGGLGFLTWEDICKNRFRLKKYRMQSKVVLLAIFFLLVLAMVFFYIFEFHQEPWKNLSERERLLASLFQAVTPRTAGFNTVDLAKMSGAGQFVTIMLMLIGGSSGSTAGGFKVTTLAVIVMVMRAVFCHREDVQCFGRRISRESVYNAITIFMLYIMLFAAGGIFISYLENLPLLTSLFEAASAIGTVGLSLGITGNLGDVSRCILIVLMFFGRVGGLTMVFAVMSGRKTAHSKYPEEKMTVG